MCVFVLAPPKYCSFVIGELNVSKLVVGRLVFFFITLISLTLFVNILFNVLKSARYKSNNIISVFLVSSLIYLYVNLLFNPIIELDFLSNIKSSFTILLYKLTRELK